jgi:hypothetical protein
MRRDMPSSESFTTAAPVCSASSASEHLVSSYCTQRACVLGVRTSSATATHCLGSTIFKPGQGLDTQSIKHANSKVVTMPQAAGCVWGTRGYKSNSETQGPAVGRSSASTSKRRPSRERTLSILLNKVQSVRGQKQGVLTRAGSELSHRRIEQTWQTPDHFKTNTAIKTAACLQTSALATRTLTSSRSRTTLSNVIIRGLGL